MLNGLFLRKPLRPLRLCDEWVLFMAEPAGSFHREGFEMQPIAF